MSREKNEKIISRNSLSHYKRASSFMNKREAAWLHLLPKLSRYRRMSESVQHDEQCSLLHDRWCLLYDEQCPSLHAEGLMHKKTLRSFIFHENTFIFRIRSCTCWCPVHMTASPIGRSEVLQTEPVPGKCYGMVNWYIVYNNICLTAYYKYGCSNRRHNLWHERNFCFTYGKLLP